LGASLTAFAFVIEIADLSGRNYVSAAFATTPLAALFTI
jgi:hypothetical protein